MCWKRVGRWLMLMLIAIVLSILVGYQVLPGDGLNAYRKVCVGMSLAQVQTQLGELDPIAKEKLQRIAGVCPASMTESIPNDGTFDGDWYAIVVHLLEWPVECGLIRVAFGKDGRVVWKRLIRLYQPQPWYNDYWRAIRSQIRAT